MRLPAPLSAAARLFGRDRAAVRGRVLDALAGTRTRPSETAVSVGALEVALCLPAGAGPHPVAVVVAEDGGAFARALAGRGVAAAALPPEVSAAALSAFVHALSGRIDINPHEIGLAIVVQGSGGERVPAHPAFAFVQRGSEELLTGGILSRVTLPN
jgi:hypothetical protein